MMYLYHYFDKNTGPFMNLSDLEFSKANSILNEIKITKPDTQCAKRDSSYIETRIFYENLVRELFVKLGGKVERKSPHYMVVGHSPWLSGWYKDCSFIKIPISEFDINTISFTYGDSHPTFSPRINDGKEYRRRVYFYDEITEVIKKHGLPQDWNDNGSLGPERYIEAQIWSDDIISKYKKNRDS